MKTTMPLDKGFGKFLKVVGTNLRTLREKQNQKIDAVANAMMITSDQLDLIEKGQFNWDVNLISRLCDHYKVSVKHIASDSTCQEKS